MVHFHSITRILVAVVVTVGAVGIGGFTSATPDPAKTVTLTPEGNQMKFAETEIRVQPGQEVTVVFENTATSSAMQHNVVFLNTADDSAIKRVGQAAMSADNYVPDDPAVIAATDIAKPGETTEVSFTVPEAPGEYTYVCTYPGHYVQMQGTMVVAK